MVKVNGFTTIKGAEENNETGRNRLPNELLTQPESIPSDVIYNPPYGT